MKLIVDSFTRDLSSLLDRHNKTITAKEGKLYLIDSTPRIGWQRDIPSVFILEAEEETEEPKQRLLFLQPR